MGKREEREALLRALYSVDIFGDYKEQSVRLLANRNKWDEVTLRKVIDILTRLNIIDNYISTHLKNWTLSRIALIDKNILRAAIYELLYETQTPMKVIINEAIEIAKKYGTKDSPTFVNAVLDAIAKEIGRTA
jgi:N utilization substance protein B